MVFIRSVARLVRPAVLGRVALTPRASSPIAYGVASYPSFTPLRTFASSNVVQESIPSVNSNTIDAVFSTTPEITTESASHAVSVQEAQQRFAVLLKEKAAIEEFEGVFKMVGDARDFTAAFAMLKEMTTAGLKPTAIIYGHVANAGRRTLRAREIRMLFGEELTREQFGVNDGPQTFSPLFSQMKEVVEMMRADGLEFTTTFWDEMAANLAGIVQGGLLVNMAVAMEKRGIQPSIFFYNKMLGTLPRCGLYDRADVLFSRMITNGLADQSTYVIRLHSLVTSGRAVEAEKCFTEMGRRFGVNRVASNIMINGHLHTRNVDAALNLLEEMKRSTDRQPDTVTANTFVNYYCDSGDLSTAPAALEYFSSIGYPSEPADYASLLKLYSRNDQGRAEQLLMSLLSTGTPLDVQVYNAVLTALTDRAVSGSLRMKIYALLCPQQYPIKDGGLAALCINAHADVRQTVARMEADGVTPNAFTADTVMKALRFRGDYDGVIAVYRFMEGQGMKDLHSARNAYLNALIHKGDSAELRDFLAVMVDRKFKLFEYNVRALQQIGVDIPNRAVLHEGGARRGFNDQKRDKQVKHNDYSDNII
jgi:pentatricopeptide repeat protein